MQMRLRQCLPRRMIMAILACIALLTAFALLPAKAWASDESGIAYLQIVNSDTGENATEKNRVATTLSEDQSMYNVRVNASSGAIDLNGCWKVIAGDTDVTDECIYEAESGLVHVPIVYADQPIDVVVSLSEEQLSTEFSMNVSIVSGVNADEVEQTSLTVTPGQIKFNVPVDGNVKAVTQDSWMLDASQWSVNDDVLTVSGRSALSVSIVVYFDTYEPAIDNQPALRTGAPDAHESHAVASPLSRSVSMLAASPRSTVSAYITCQNPGPGDWDYTDYTVTWNGNSARVYCCEHGVYHMPQSDGGWVNLQMTLQSTDNLGTSLTGSTDSTLTYTTRYRDNYYLYVNAGYYQDVDGYWSTTRSSSYTQPRYGTISVQKKSSNPSISSTSHYKYNAKYNVYSDSGCRNYVGQISCNDGGYGTMSVRAGSTYYVREAVAPQGFDLSSTVYSVYVRPDTTNAVNGGSVYDSPRSATIIYVADGVEVKRHTNVPIGSTHYVDNDATSKATKPNCTPGFDGWYTSSSYGGSKFTSKVMGDETLYLYGRNLLTLSFAYSSLSDHDQFDSYYARPAQMIDEATPVSIALPANRVVAYGTTVSLASRPDVFSPTVGLHDDTDVPFWNTLRARCWNTQDDMSLANVNKITLYHDQVMYIRYEKTPTDGVIDNRDK